MNDIMSLSQKFDWLKKEIEECYDFLKDSKLSKYHPEYRFRIEMAQEKWTELTKIQDINIGRDFYRKVSEIPERGAL